MQRLARFHESELTFYSQTRLDCSVPEFPSDCLGRAKKSVHRNRAIAKEEEFSLFLSSSTMEIGKFDPEKNWLLPTTVSTSTMCLKTASWKNCWSRFNFLNDHDGRRMIVHINSNAYILDQRKLHIFKVLFKQSLLACLPLSLSRSAARLTRSILERRKDSMKNESILCPFLFCLGI